MTDIGSRGGVTDQWMQFAPHISVYGFEPDEVECDRLNREDQVATYMPFALGSAAGEQPFYVTTDPFCSSLFRPVEELVRERPRLAEMNVRQVTTIKTRTIDEWADEYGIRRLDHLKIDAQGAELAILEGAARSLGSIRSINLEVQFSRLYEETPLFGDIDLFLRERGFVLWRLSELSHCAMENASANHQVPEIFNYDFRRVDVSASGGQLMWANAYYVRRETTQLSQQLDWSDAIRDACIAHAHHYDDLAEVCLQRTIQGAPDEVQAICGSALSDAATFGARLVDPVQQMQVVMNELKQAADERLVLVNQLKHVADERLALIDELQGVATERLRALEDATARLAAQSAEVEALRVRVRESEGE